MRTWLSRLLATVLAFTFTSVYVSVARGQDGTLTLLIQNL